MQYGKEASETVQDLLRKRLVSRITKVYLRKTSNETKIQLIRKSKTSVWHKQLLSTPPARHVNQEGKRVASEKHMDWGPASRANITTIGNRGLCSTISITKERFDKVVAPRFLNGDVAQMVERSLSMREVRWSLPRISNFSEESGNQKKGIREAVLLDQKKTWICTFVRGIWKGSISNSTELAEKAIGVPNHQGLPQKNVGGNITILIRESKTSVWHIQLLWTPPARHVNREGKRLACEKHMDWWPASTKPKLQRYAIEDSVQLFQKQRKGLWGNSSPFPQRGCSSDGRALALHARGTGIDAPHLQFFRGVRK